MEVEKAEAAIAHQAAADSAAQAKKRKATSGKMPMASKKPKMASVQQLHTSNSTDHAQSQSASHSRSANQAHSANSDVHRSAIRSELETSSPLQGGQISGAQQDADQGGKGAFKSSVDNARSVGASADLTKASEVQQLSARTSSASAGAGQKQMRSPEQDGKNKGKGLTSVKEYFVKWKGKSFIHCSWVKHDDVVKVAKYSAGLNMRFKYYQRSVYGMPQVVTLSGIFQAPSQVECINHQCHLLLMLTKHASAEAGLQAELMLNMRCVSVWPYQSDTVFR